VIFVGSAEEERRGFTRFSVDEVWNGPDLGPDVWVQSGQQQPPWPLNLVFGVSSSVDVQFRIGESYVVGASRDFHTSECSVQALAGEIDPGLRPDNVRTPVSDGAEGADPPIGPWAIGLILTGVAAASGAGLVLYRRRRSANKVERSAGG
jgi:hypothetical protein